MGSLKASEQDRDGCGLNNEATLANEHLQQQQQQQQQPPQPQPQRQHQQQQQEQAETIYLRLDTPQIEFIQICSASVFVSRH